MATAKRPVGRPRKDAKRPVGRPRKTAVAIAPKKAAPKKAPKVTAWAELPWRSSTSGADFDQQWSINRSAETVSFGCGAVKVSKADLKLVAENPEVLKAFERIWEAARSRSYSHYNAQRVLNILKDSKSVRAICGC